MAQAEHTRSYYLAHREEVIARSKAWAEKNPEKKKESSLLYSRKHKEKRKAYKEKWRAENPEKERSTDRRRYTADPEKGRTRTRKWRSLHQDKSRSISNNWKKANPDRNRACLRKWQGEHPEDGILRSAVQRMLRNRFTRKTSLSKKYVGCTPGFLRNHLESLFKPGMTWENYGTAWEVDHIVPLSWFPFDKDQSLFSVASHWTNLQPLWKSVNRSKRNRHAA